MLTTQICCSDGTARQEIVSASNHYSITHTHTHAIGGITTTQVMVQMYIAWFPSLPCFFLPTITHGSRRVVKKAWGHSSCDIGWMLTRLKFTGWAQELSRVSGTVVECSNLANWMMNWSRGPAGLTYDRPKSINLGHSHDECYQAFPAFRHSSIHAFPCIIVNANQTKNNGVSLLMSLPWIDVLCTTHTHTCGKEEHARVASRMTSFISEKVRVL